MGSRARRFLLASAVALAAACDRGGARATPGKADDASSPSSTAFPVTVKDDLGREVTVKTEPKRIVVLVPSHTETVFALGLGARIVGVDDASDFPPAVKDLPKLGTLYDPRVEQILGLAPDLVIASPFGPTPERLTAAGLTVWAGAAAQLADVFRVIDGIGHLTGSADAASDLERRVHADLDAVEARLRALPRVRVYYEIDPTPYSVGPESFLGALIAKAGGDDIVPPGLGDFPRISPELVIARDPEVILGASIEDVSRRPGWSAITAVKRRAAFTLTPAQQSAVTRSGPRIAEGLAALGEMIHRAAPAEARP